MYDPVVGRFTGVDPIGERFAWVPAYNYAENEPVGHVDLWGLQAASAEIAMDRDVKELTSGQITRAEYNERLMARFKGGVAGVTLAGGVSGGIMVGENAALYPITAMEVVSTGGAFIWGVFDEGNQIDLPGPIDDSGRFASKLFNKMSGSIRDLFSKNITIGLGIEDDLWRHSGTGAITWLKGAGSEQD